MSQPQIETRQKIHYKKINNKPYEVIVIEAQKSVVTQSLVDGNLVNGDPVRSWVMIGELRKELDPQQIPVLIAQKETEKTSIATNFNTRRDNNIDDVDTQITQLNNL